MKTYKRQYLTFTLPADRPVPADTRLSDDPLTPSDWQDIAACRRHGDPAEFDGEDTGEAYDCSCPVGRL